MRADIFLRLPTPTALLVLSSILKLTQANVIPQQTTIQYRVLNVAAWPPLPTPAPISPLELNELRRRQDTNTICGYIGGDPNLPATCGAGSHCVVDTDHNAIGCCPNGQQTCTTGVFTGCVDFNSGAQTEVNPYVFTCQGSDVCYQNVFDGGFSQYGCGTASSLATSVRASASGITKPASASSLSVSFTAKPSSLATPTSIDPSTGTRSFTRSTGTSSTSHSTSRSSSTTSSSSSSKSSSSTSSSSTSSPAVNPTVAAAPASTETGSSVDRTGAIVGGTISGVAVLVAVIALGIFCWRKKKLNTRKGPGAGGTEYISPMTGGPAFHPLHSNAQGYETGLRPDLAHDEPHGTTTQISGGGPAPHGYRYEDPTPWHDGPPAMSGAAMGVGMGAGYGVYRDAPTDSDQVPLRGREIDDFSRGFHDALGRIGEEQPQSGDLAEYSGSSSGNLNGAMAGNGNGNSHGLGDANANGQYAAESTAEGGGRPLWQQNRRQSRNLMWM